MTQANIHDRASVEAIYPREAFIQDANSNARGDVTVVRGVKILSEPDDQGNFRLSAASQHVGEHDPMSDAIFLAAQMHRAANVLSQVRYSGKAEKGDALEKLESQDDEYEAFVKDVLAAASNAEFKPAIGAGEERLKGFHGG